MKTLRMQGDASKTSLYARVSVLERELGAQLENKESFYNSLVFYVRILMTLVGRGLN